MPAQKTLLSSLVALGLAAAWSSAPARAADVPVDLELVLAVDVSGSIDPAEAELQRRGYVEAFSHPQIAEAIESGITGRIAVAYIEWAGQNFQQTVLDWTLIENKNGAFAFADALAETPVGSGRWTSLSGAIDYAMGLFDGNGYEGMRQVIDVSGDGVNNSGRPVVDARDEAVAAGVTINGLAIINHRPNPWGGLPAADLDRYFEDYVIGGPGAFVIVARDFQHFASAILSKLILEIAGLTPEDADSRHAALVP